MRRKGLAVVVGIVMAALTSVVLYAVASYPSSVKSFSTRTDGQTIAASWFNDLQDEVVAIEQGLLNGIAHTLKPDGDVTRSFGTDALRWLHPNGTASAPGIAIRSSDNGLYSSGTDAIELATNGTKALGIDATQFIDSPTQPRASAYNNTTQSLTDATQTALALNTEDFDVSTLHDTATNNTRMTIPTGGDGLYMVIGQATYATNATGVRVAAVRKNGATILTYSQVPAASGASTHVAVSVLVVLAATDYVELIGVQNSGGALNSGNVTREYSNILQVVKLW